MRAVVCTNAELGVVDRPEPVPARGQVRLEVLRCGICGSDLHARHGCDEWAEMAARAGYDRFARSDQPIVFGHEFCGQVAEHGPGCRRTLPTRADAPGLQRQDHAESDVRTVVASDFAPGRRALASACGADVVVDPAQTSPFSADDEHGHVTDIPSALELAVGTRERLERLPFGWWHAWRLAETLGAAPKHPVIFECVGVPGVIESIIEGAPLFSRVVVVGVCVGVDRITPAMAINKELDLRFVLGYTPLEFRDTLQMLAEGKVDPRPLITGTVGLDGVDNAFAALGDPEAQAKILIDPHSEAARPEDGRRTAPSVPEYPA